MKRIAALAVVLTLSLPVNAGPETQPVLIGRFGSVVDACPSDSVTKISVVVRSAPSSSAAKVLVLKAGTAVYSCGGPKGSSWEGIVIPAYPNQDCKADINVATPRPYSGPCRSGWVPAHSLRVVAG